MYGDADDVKVAAFCSSEPDAGSDVASMRTRAVYDEVKGPLRAPEGASQLTGVSKA